MKLLTKTTLFFLTISFFVLFIGGIVFYFAFRYIMNREVKRELVSELSQMMKHPPKIQDYQPDSAFNYLTVHYTLRPVGKISRPFLVFGDTMLVDNISNQYQPFRKLTFETSIDGTPVSISVYKSLMFSDELVDSIVFITLLLSLLMLGFIIFLNKYFFNSLWGSFLNTIDLIKDYRISEAGSLMLPESEITEFNLLNDVFRKMHERIRHDYQNLKEFIENVSHEIQNPLAIIKSRVDLLQQSTSLDESQAGLLKSIQGSVSRLSNLNRSLILLSQIENNQFQVRELVDIGKIIDQHIENFDDFIKARELDVTKTYKNTLLVRCDPDLISIMLLNLLKNSIFHNINSGTVTISIDGNVLSIVNTGRKLEIDPEDIFKRFIKSSGRPESLGLGLAIVKKICDYYNFAIRYTADDIYHNITITINEEQTFLRAG